MNKCFARWLMALAVACPLSPAESWAQKNPLREVTPQELKTILAKHELFLMQPDVIRAVYPGMIHLPDGKFESRIVTLEPLAARYPELYANLSNTSLRHANMRDADLSGANLSGASLYKGKLIGARLKGANLSGAWLWEADLRDANLGGANLSGANLSGANLSFANLSGANLSDSNLDSANLAKVIYAPKLESGAPESKERGVRGPNLLSISQARNLHRMRYSDDPSALIALRKGFKDYGFRDAERDVTVAIERCRTEQAFLNPFFYFRAQSSSLGSFFGVLSGLIEFTFKVLLFEWTVDYGRVPGRALWLAAGLWLICGLVYIFGLRNPPKDGRWGIFREWRGRARPELLRASRWRDFLMAFWFSLLSAFHFGWRDLNVGAWLSRIQSREYNLRPVGWVRVVSGWQSLVTVYLIAIWALSYFGRPFE